MRRMTLLTMQLRFEASKMQASSTQKTKDSAGRRLGMNMVMEVLRNSEEKRHFLTISSSGKEA